MEVLWEIELAVPALFHYDFGVRCLVLIFEGSESADHLANQDADAPYVRLVGMADLGEHYLRGAIPWRATIRVRPSIDVLQLLGEPKVYQFHVPLSVDQDVLRLEIPVDDIFRMQTFDGQDDLGEVKSGSIFAHENGFSYLSDKFSAGQIIQKHVQIVLIL